MFGNPLERCQTGRGHFVVMQLNEARTKRGNMLIKLKGALMILICVVVLAQLAGCVYDRHGHRPDDRNFHHDRDQGQVNLNVNLH